MYGDCNNDCASCKEFFEKTCPFTREEIQKAHEAEQKQLAEEKTLKKAREAEEMDRKRTACGGKCGCEDCYANEHLCCPFCK